MDGHNTLAKNTHTVKTIKKCNTQEEKKQVHPSEGERNRHRQSTGARRACYCRAPPCLSNVDFEGSPVYKQICFWHFLQYSLSPSRSCTANDSIRDRMIRAGRLWIMYQSKHQMTHESSAADPRPHSQLAYLHGLAHSNKRHSGSPTSKKTSNICK